MMKKTKIKDMKEEIEIEALKTTYPLALKRGIEIGRQEEREELIKIIDEMIKLGNKEGRTIHIGELKQKLKEIEHDNK